MNWTAIFGALLFAAGLFVFWSCKSSKATQKQTGALLYEFERTGCLGKCPVYRLQIYADQRLTITPRRNLLIDDPQTTVIEQAELEELKTLLSASNTQGLDSLYDNGVTDAPFAILTLYASEPSQTIRCRGDAPPAFADAMHAIEQLAVQRGWLESAEGSVDVDMQLILDLTSNEVVPAIEAKYAAHKLKLIKRIAPRQSYYLFSVDVIAEEKTRFLELLKEDPLIRQVQWNHKLDKR